MSRPAVDYALKYAECGFKVFPVYVFVPEGATKPVKRPPRTIRLGILCDKHEGLSGAKGSKNDKAVKDCRECRGGHHVATTDPDEIRRQFRIAGPGAVVAVMPPEGVLILDDDSGVFDSIWSDRPYVRTVSGKRHYYFKLDEGQEPIRSDNLIEYGGPDDLVDVRCDGDDRWIVVPGGCPEKYAGQNGWAIEPETYPLLPGEVYERLLTAPRASGGGGGGGPAGRNAPGVPRLVVGSPYDRDADAAAEILDRHGWAHLGGDYWTRPGGSGNENATLRENDRGVWFFNVFTDRDDRLQSGHYYTPSMLRCVLDDDGDWRATYQALIAEALNQGENA